MSHGTYNGRPLIVRVNAGLRELAGHPDLRHQVGIAVPLKRATDTGLPAPEEDRELAALEDELAATLSKGRQAVLAGILTTGGMREFVFYTGEPEAIRRTMAEIQGRIEHHDIQLMIQEDPSWQVFKSLLK